MEKTVTFTIEKTAVKISTLLTDRFSARLIAKIKHGGKILLDGQAVHSNVLARQGQTVQFVIDCPEEEALPQQADIKVAYQDDDYLIVDKGVNIPCMPVSKGKYSLCNGLAYLFPKQKFYVMTRLDKDTQGLVLLAKNSYAASKVKPVPMEKTYLALARGRVESQTIALPVYTVRGKAKRVVDARGKAAKTQVTLLTFDGENSIIECNLLTGRTHQIRLHLSAIGHPLVGDRLYGDGKEGEAQKLLCKRLSFVQPLTGKKIQVESERTL